MGRCPDRAGSMVQHTPPNPAPRIGFGVRNLIAEFVIPRRRPAPVYPGPPDSHGYSRCPALRLDREYRDMGVPRDHFSIVAGR